MLTNIIGFLGTVTSSVALFPQAVKIWNCRHNPEALEGISLATSILFLSNAVLWAIYAVLTQAWWSGVASLIVAPLQVFVILLLLRRKTSYHDNRA